MTVLSGLWVGDNLRPRANIDVREQDFRVSMPDRSIAKVKWEDRTIAVKGRLVDRLEPLAVRVYEVE